MRKTKSKTFSRKSRITSLILALLLTVSAAGAAFATLASAVVYEDDSGGLAETGNAAYGEMNVPTIAAGSAKAFWVDATYYDYLSDAEKQSDRGWLNPIQAGTGFSGAENDWYEFYSFNNRIHEATNGTGVYPLYFGNFCNSINYGGSGTDSYSGTSYDLKYNGNTLDASYDANHGGPYEHAMSYTHGNSNNSTKLYNYEYFINNSNGLSNYHYAVTGLADNKLSDSGSIKFKNGGEMPYFNSAWLRDDSRQIGQVINSQFPFREDKINDNVTLYSFNSENAMDNVYFNWSGKTPTAVGYGQTETYGVKDGIQYFMNPDDKDPDTNQPYKNKNYYGIFPFNTASGSNGGNNKLDYGFGIKMNMDFRVPKNGTIDGSNSNNEEDAIKFTYTGDDDLWVYITPYNDNGNLDWSNSQLVLDLGGSHKKASGNINFHTMTASVSAAKEATSTYFRPDTIYIINNGTKSNSTPFSDLKVWAWTENADGTSKSDGAWINVGRQDEYYTIKASDMAGRNKFIVSQGTWERQTEKDSRRASGYYGNITYTDNLEWITENRSEASGSSKAFGFESNGSGGYKTLDPDKTYRMTIFYMERGMIESNCSMAFSMTPIKNDFKVNKTVDVEDINTNESANSIRAALRAMDYSFTTTEKSEANPNGEIRKDTKYVLNSNWYNVNSSTGVYQLKHGQTADFPNQHETGNTLVVTESAPRGLAYETTWNVVDNNNGGTQILPAVTADSGEEMGEGTVTDDIVLQNPSNSSAPANLQANFINKPLSAPPLSISKRVYSEDPANTADRNDDWDDYLIDNEDIEDEFAFTLLINLKGQAYSASTAADFKAYNLDYDLFSGTTSTSKTAENGQFSLRAGDKVNFKGLPVGATFHLTEEGCAGYTPAAYEWNDENDVQRYEPISGSAGGVNAAINGTVGDDGDEFIFYNVQAESLASFRVTKYLTANNTDTQYKNGNLFTFRAKALGSVAYAAGKTSVNAASQNPTAGYVEVGTVGTDGYAVFANGGEDPFLKLNHAGVYIYEVWESAVGGTDATKKAISVSNQKFLVKFTVTAQGTGLEISEPEYFVLNGSDANITANSFGAKVNVPQFKNPLKTGSVKVDKKDGGGKGLGGVEFKVYRKGESDAVATFVTNSNGIATCSNLDIYKKTGSNYAGTPDYQEYELKETTTKDGHYMEKTVYTWKFDTPNAQGNFEYTASYVNGALKHPETGMFDVIRNMPLGVALIFLSFVAIGLYIAVLRKKQLAAVHHKPRFYE